MQAVFTSHPKTIILFKTAKTYILVLESLIVTIEVGVEISSLVFSAHAVQRMFERSIDKQVVIDAVHTGLIIERYDDDKPYPSRLVIGWTNVTPVHVVFAVDSENDRAIVITVYVPSSENWSENYTRRQ